jgi:hypothetical protein
MTWAGFLIAVATAAIGGAASLMISGKHLVFAFIVIGFASWIFFAAWISVDAIRPKKYSFPGNVPENWLRENWMCYPTGPYDLAEARVEQAVCLNNGIDDNAQDAESHAKALKRSMDHALLAVAYAGMSTFGVLLWSAITSTPERTSLVWL